MQTDEKKEKEYKCLLSVEELTVLFGTLQSDWKRSLPISEPWKEWEAPLYRVDLFSAEDLESALLWAHVDSDHCKKAKALVSYLIKTFPERSLAYAYSDSQEHWQKAFDLGERNLSPWKLAEVHVVKFERAFPDEFSWAWWFKELAITKDNDLHFDHLTQDIKQLTQNAWKRQPDAYIKAKQHIAEHGKEVKLAYDVLKQVLYDAKEEHEEKQKQTQKSDAKRIRAAQDLLLLLKRYTNLLTDNHKEEAAQIFQLLITSGHGLRHHPYECNCSLHHWLPKQVTFPDIMIKSQKDFKLALQASKALYLQLKSTKPPYLPTSDSKGNVLAKVECRSCDGGRDEIDHQEYPCYADHLRHVICQGIKQLGIVAAQEVVMSNVDVRIPEMSQTMFQQLSIKGYKKDAFAYLQALTEVFQLPENAECDPEFYNRYFPNWTELCRDKDYRELFLNVINA